MDEKDVRSRKVTLRERTARALDLPAEGLAGLPRLELIGDRELYLENYKDILSYSREEVCVDGGGWMLRAAGRDLEIKGLREGELRLVGWLDRLELV